MGSEQARVSRWSFQPKVRYQIISFHLVWTFLTPAKLAFRFAAIMLEKESTNVQSKSSMQVFYELAIASTNRPQGKRLKVKSATFRTERRIPTEKCTIILCDKKGTISTDCTSKYQYCCGITLLFVFWFIYHRRGAPSKTRVSRRDVGHHKRSPSGEIRGH